ncbi:MAG: autotransporter-associated beta strand repeat-containing protein [Verrucomicrobiales bacterium]|nr:autotransporter-associated beta strand repeat-containing protein [Verrucomicrobiales bacterium]
MIQILNQRLLIITKLRNIGVFLCAFLACFSVFAQKTWQGSGTDNWNNAANWSPSGAPSTQTVYISNGGTAVIGAGVSGSGGTVWLGASTGSSGALLVNGGSLAAIGDLVVGGTGSGELTVTSGYVSNVAGYVGYGPGGNGTVLINGSGWWRNTGYLSIGYNATGTGSLTIAGSGSVSAGASMDIGSVYGGSGVLNIQDQGYLLSTGYFGVGYNGNALVTLVDSGSLYASTFISLAYGAGSSGQMNVGGQASVRAGTNIDIGLSGAGLLAITGSGRVTAASYANVGYYANSSGVLDIRDHGQFSASGYFAIGNSGTGAVLLRDYARVQAGDLYIYRTGVLDILLTPGRTDPWFTANNVVNLSGTLRISGLGDGTAYTRASELAADSQILINSTNAFSGTFSSIVTGSHNLPDYLVLTVTKSADNKQYRAGPGLAWNSGSATGNGVFSIGNGKSFDLDLGLSDRTDVTNFTSGWNGKNLTKQGEGTLVISAAQQYSGITTVKAGQLEVTSGGSLAGDVAVIGGKFSNNGANLGGSLTLASGTIGGTNYRGQQLSFTNAGQVLAPGNSIGALTADSVTFAANGVFELEIGGATVNDLLITDTLILADGGFTINVSKLDFDDFDPDGDYAWTFVTYTTLDGTVDSDSFTVNTGGFTIADGKTFTVSVTGNTLVLNYSAVPEPSTWMLLLVAVLLLSFCRLIRNTKKNLP